MFSGDSEYKFVPPTKKIVSFANKGEKVCCVNDNIVSVLSLNFSYEIEDWFVKEMENTIVSTFCGKYLIDSLGFVWKLNPYDNFFGPVKISPENFPEIISIGCCDDVTYFVGKDKTLWGGKFDEVKQISDIYDALHIFSHSITDLHHFFILCENGKILRNNSNKVEEGFSEFLPFSNVKSISFSRNVFSFLLSNEKVFNWTYPQTMSEGVNNVQRIDNFSWFISNDGLLCNGNQIFETCRITACGGQEIGEESVSYFIDYYPCSDFNLFCWTRNEVNIPKLRL